MIPQHFLNETDFIPFLQGHSNNFDPNKIKESKTRKVIPKIFIHK